MLPVGLVVYGALTLWLARLCGYLIAAGDLPPPAAGWALFGALFWALAPALLLSRGALMAWFGAMLLFLMLLVYAAAGYYEGVFGRLPGVGVLHYFSEWSHLRASAGFAPVACALALLLAVMPLLPVRGARERGGLRPLVLWVVIPVLALGAMGALLHRMPSTVPGGAERTARDPLFWLLASAEATARSANAENTDLDAALELYTRALGPGLPLRGDPAAPLCSGDDDPRSGNGRNVILVVLESVSAQTLMTGEGDAALMPRLRAAAWGNAFLPGLVSAGGKSAQGLFSYLTGQAVHPRLNLLLFPGLRVAGWPERLKERGYDTWYFHGGVLSFENQRSFLHRAGFENLVELDQSQARATSDWGWDDAYMVDRLLDWLTARGPEDPPHLAMWFTLSTHHPYVTPVDWRDSHAPITVAGMSTDQVRAYRFLDAQVGRLVDWFNARPAGDDTLLVLTGDHPADSATGPDIPYLPLVILGLDEDERAALSAADGRLAGAHDLPATLNALLDIHSGPCNRGMDILAPDWRWNPDRWVYNVGGPT